VKPFGEIWGRIEHCQGEVFYQKRGKGFTYIVQSGCVVPNTTTRLLPKSHFEKAVNRMPLAGPGGIQDLQGPSYLFAILTDPRISP
jgi:hypothetical protein